MLLEYRGIAKKWRRFGRRVKRDGIISKIIGLQRLLYAIVISGTSLTVLLIYKLSIICPSRDTANLSILLLKCLEPIRDAKTILVLIYVNIIGLVCPCIWISEIY